MAMACGSSSNAPDADSTVDALAGDASSTDAASCPQGGATGVINDSISVRDQARDYILSVPSSYDDTRPYPLVFAWHGRGSNSAQARSYFGIEESAAGAAIVVYPQGLPMASIGNDTGWDLTGAGVDVALFDALLENVSSNYCIDAARVFSAGHSFGGYMSNELACVRGDDIRAIASIAGGGPFNPCTSSGTAAWIVHGSVDSVVLLSEGIASRNHWRDANDCAQSSAATEPSPCQLYADCEAEHPLIWCEHYEPAFAGHGWPTFVSTGIWPFFASL
jgi:polyhydroxybutyrate depolymerase